MKRLTVTVFILLILSLSVTSNVFGMTAYHIGEPDDQWYTVTPEKSCWQLNYSNASSIDYQEVYGEFYQNDQTFININIAKHQLMESCNSYNWTVYSDIAGLNASYLFDCGLFFGFKHSHYSNEEILSKYGNITEEDYIAVVDYIDSTHYSPGYRYAIDANSYAAVSVDILDNERLTEVVGYEFNLKYFLEKLYLGADINSYHYPDTESETQFNGRLNYQISNQFVWGLGINMYQKQSNNDTYYAGFTWTSNPLILNFSSTYQSSDDNLHKLYAIYQINNYGLGLQLSKYSDLSDLAYAFVFSSQLSKGKLKIYYAPEHDNYIENYSLVYYQRL